MGLPTPTRDLASMGTQAMAVLLTACFLTVIFIGQLLLPVLQWEARMLDRFSQGGE